MNRQTVQDVDEALERYHRKVMLYMNKIDALRKKRKRMMTNQIKVAPPKPVKVMFKSLRNFPFNDALPEEMAERPIAPGATGPC